MSGPVALQVTVNGTMTNSQVDARTTLVDFLRFNCGLIGTKVGCEQGVCGSCTILVDDLPARGCLMLAVSAHGSSVRTVESLAAEELSDLQRSFRDHHALQCGFCTPGLLMTAQSLLEAPEDEAINVHEAVSGHLCRCTGYEPIVAAIETALRRSRSSV